MLLWFLPLKILSISISEFYKNVLNEFYFRSFAMKSEKFPFQYTSKNKMSKKIRKSLLIESAFCYPTTSCLSRLERLSKFNNFEWSFRKSPKRHENESSWVKNCWIHISILLFLQEEEKLSSLSYFVIYKMETY